MARKSTGKSHLSIRGCNCVSNVSRRETGKQDRTRNKVYKLEKSRFRKEIGSHWISNRVAEEWNGLSNHIVVVIVAIIVPA